MNKMEILIIISALLLPVNLYCSFWIFREVLNLSGITFREMLKDLNGLAIPSGRFVSIGTFISFLIGEIVEYMTIYFKDK